ncbi:hypothetical protein AC1031_016189 [Aphanomyces cochlioides]|nr:hypothetical protein AC1031_016189 [Aphanomyces cochlioides]
MSQMRLNCAVVGEATPFNLHVDADLTVEMLKKMILVEFLTTSRCDAKKLEIYSVDGLEQDEDAQFVLNGTRIDMTKVSLIHFVGCTKKLTASFPLSSYPELMNPSLERIHVVMVAPETPKRRAVTKREWREEELATLHPQIQCKVWKSVVRVVFNKSSSMEDWGSALVVVRTSTHLYLLTNLHLFLNEQYSNSLSDEFKSELQRYASIHSGEKPIGDHEADAPSMCEISIEQFIDDENALMEISKITLERGHCLHSSADFDLAILEVPTPHSVQIDLVPCRMAHDVCPTMPVYVFGFPRFQHPQVVIKYAITPAQVISTHGNQMALSTLSLRCLSGSGIVCNLAGSPVGYLCGGERSHPLGYTLKGIPKLTSQLPAMHK